MFYFLYNKILSTFFPTKGRISNLILHLTDTLIMYSFLKNKKQYFKKFSKQQTTATFYI